MLVSVWDDKFKRHFSAPHPPCHRLSVTWPMVLLQHSLKNVPSDVTILDGTPALYGNITIPSIVFAPFAMYDIPSSKKKTFVVTRQYASSQFEKTSTLDVR